jgi:hypothetical protein
MASSISNASWAIVTDVTILNGLTNALANASVQLKSENKKNSIPSGTADGQFDRVWASKSRTLNAAATEDIDLNTFTGLDVGAGAGKDPLGVALTLVEVCGILVVRDQVSTGELRIGGSASNEFTSLFVAAGDAIKVPPKGIFFIGTLNDPAFPVSGTNKNLKFLAQTAQCIWDMYVFGRSA